MNKRIIILIFLSSLIILLSLYICQIIKRISIEEKNKVVEMALDFEDLKNLSVITKTEIPKLLDVFEKKGINSIVVKLDSLDVLPKHRASIRKIIKICKEDEKTLNDIYAKTVVIFENNEIFNSKTVIAKNLKVALVEFYKPIGYEGIHAENLITLHTFKENEIFKYSKDKIIKRFLRACVERKIKILYVKLNFGFKDILGENLELIEDLKINLIKSGFVTGRVDENPYILGSDKYIWFKKIISFLISIIFPIFGFIVSLKMKRIQWKFLVILVSSFCGIILISGLLPSSLFLIKVEQYAGAKLSLALPSFFIFFYLLYLNKEILKATPAPSGAWVKFFLPIIISLLVVFFILMILRSGNYSFPLFPFEENVREFFENIFVARPRLKEFLIGHPLLIFGLYFYSKTKNNVEKIFSILFISLGFVGQTSMINTFCHLHTNFIISLLRTIYGLILGVFIGYILIICQKIARKS
ncbi:MAG: DUF5693 family protein [Candidatus Firestonebacteria bacterium]